VIAPNGSIVVQAKYDEEDIAFGSVDYADSERTEIFVPTLRDLRPELYDSLKEQAERL
jgi:predicted amidohydrolase